MLAMDNWAVRLFIGLIGSTAIAWLAYRRSSLSGSGAISAAVMGSAYFALGGPVWFGTLLVFFGTSTFWSKWKRRHRAKRSAEANYAKGGRRDAVQVWANGGLGLALCAAHAVHPDPGWLYAFAGVMAAVNADTWATEIGALSRTAPRALLSGASVPPGTSGGVTPLGSAAAFAGAAAIGAAVALLGALAPLSALPAAAGSLSVAAALGLAGIAAAAGLAGAFADSLLGATAQAMYRCEVCGCETERTSHCGSHTKRIRGISFMNNDAVNLLSSTLAGFLCWLAAFSWL